MSNDNEVLVKVEGVSKIFCRDLKKSLLYGLKDSAKDLLSWGNKNEDRGSKIVDQDLRQAYSSDPTFNIQNSKPVPRRNTSGADLRPGEFYAVRDVSFELRRGECLGLIGRNGAGKTTLLKMLNGLIKPDAGRIEMRGRIGALIALGAGFNPILSGRENIYVNGSILGLSSSEIDAKIDEIIDFAEIGEFIDTPVQSYSSGMQVRLGFAVASAMEPDVLILDEVLAVGDIRFRSKCYNRLSKFSSKSAIIVVSHNKSDIARTCDIGIVMEGGKGTEKIPLQDALDIYEKINLTKTDQIIQLNADGINLDSISLSSDTINWGDSLTVNAKFKIQIPLHNIFYRVTITDSADNCVAEWQSLNHNNLENLNLGVHEIKIPLKNIRIAEGSYKVNFIMGQSKQTAYLILRYAFQTIQVNRCVIGLCSYQL